MTKAKDYPVPDDFELTSDTICPHPHEDKAPRFVCWTHKWCYDKWYHRMRESMLDSEGA